MHAHRLARIYSGRRGFSLVEIALAIAVLAIALVALLGVMPSGVENFHSTMDTSTTSQIAQRILHEAEQTEFDVLIDRAGLPPDPAGRSYCPLRFTFRAPRVSEPGWRYFDEQGKEIRPKNKEGRLDAAEMRALVYQVNTRIRPRAELPTINESSSQVAQITVQIVRNPNLTPVPLIDDPDSPEHNLFDPKTRLKVFTYSGLVGRSSG